MVRFTRAILIYMVVVILITSGISHADEPFTSTASLDEVTLEMISEASVALLGANISGDEEWHAESVTDGKHITAWLFNLENGDIACFEVPDDRSCLYINMGNGSGTFRVNFEQKITLGERVY